MSCGGALLSSFVGGVEGIFDPDAWSANGKPLKSFEEVLKAKEVVLGKTVAIAPSIYPPCRSDLPNAYGFTIGAMLKSRSNG